MKSIKRVRRISAEGKQLLADLKEIVLGFVPDATLIVYGSTVRGTRTPESDYDVLILLNEPISKELHEELDTAIYALELDREVALSTFLVTREQWNLPRVVGSPFRRNVELEAVLL